MTKNWQPLKPIRNPFLSFNPEQAAEILKRHKTICAFIRVHIKSLIRVILYESYRSGTERTSCSYTLPIVIPRINPKWPPAATIFLHFIKWIAFGTSKIRWRINISFLIQNFYTEWVSKQYQNQVQYIRIKQFNSRVVLMMFSKQF